VWGTRRIPFVGATADPSTSPEAGCARDDNSRVLGGDRGPSTPAAQPQAACAQDDKHKNLGAPPLSPVFGDRVGTNDDQEIFWAFVNAGRRLADLHVNYEQQPEYPLERIEKGQLNWRVEKVRLGKDKTSLIYNDFLTPTGAPWTRRQHETRPRCRCDPCVVPAGLKALSHADPALTCWATIVSPFGLSAWNSCNREYFSARSGSPVLGMEMQIGTFVILT